MKEVPFVVADPDLQIREGSGHPDPEIMGGGGGERGPVSLWASVCSSNRRGGDPGPSPGCATAFVNRRYTKGVPFLPKMEYKKVS